MNCPSCGTKIDADFGMISCPMCSAVFMVEMDGTIQELKAESEISPEEESINLGFEPVPEAADNYLSPEPAEEYTPPEPLAEEPSFESPVNEDLAADASEDFFDESVDEAVDEPAEDPATEEAENIYTENFMDDFNDSPEKPSDGKDPLGVVAFDESAASGLGEGLYYYDLKISGLDSAQIRESVVDALTDPRFDWVGDEIKKKISGGELILRNLNPVKAVFAVIRLQPLDVEVDWEQKLYTDESVQEKEGEA